LISVQDLTIHLGRFALDSVHFEIGRGEYAVLMGKTGSGKTTILEAVCGLRPVVSGVIRLHGRNVCGLKPAQRGIGYVPQDGALFSTMTVRENLAFALVVRKWSRAAIDERVSELADLLGVAHLLDRRPQGLSGGESQRIALGRALAASPGVLCLDEPLSALDDATREEMYSLLKSVRQRTGVTALHVTHSLAEAERLADRVLILREGRIDAVESLDADAEQFLDAKRTVSNSEHRIDVPSAVTGKD
jgi:molybdate/tungstate transport system ATP-binding protein